MGKKINMRRDTDDLRQASAKLRTPADPDRCTCDRNEKFIDVWFDRTICPPPCDSMHNRCVDCGAAIDGCSHDEIERQPSAYDLAVADWLDHVAEEREAAYRLGARCVVGLPDMARAVAVAVLERERRASASGGDTVAKVG